MTMKKPRLAHPRRPRGVVMVFVLITLVIMLIGAVAIMRSVDSTMFAAGNVAFKRDLMNQAEQVAVQVADALSTGGLSTPTQRAANNQALNYSATMLPTNSQGIPTVLLDTDSNLNSSGFASTANDIHVNGRAVTIRYVIDRLCGDVGDEALLGADKCITSTSTQLGGSGSQMQNAQFNSSGGAGASAVQIVYRVSIRVTGPRDTQAFYQTTFTL